jgi:hypothetical protein
MTLPLDESANQVVADLQDPVNPTLDDVFVPGIGVRSALADDSPPTRHFSLQIREACARGKTVAKSSAARIIGKLRDAKFQDTRTQLSPAIKMLASYRPTFPAGPTNSVRHDLRNTRDHLANYGRQAVTRIRIATRNTSINPHAREAIWRALTATPSWLLRVRQIAQDQIRRDKRRGFTPTLMPAALVRSRHWVEAILRSSAVWVQSLREAVRYPNHFRISIDHKRAQVVLRRAAPALGMMLLILVFMIQEIVVAMRR